MLRSSRPPPRSRASRAPLPWIAAVVLLVACEEAPPPWAAPADGGVLDESQPFLPSDRHDGWLLDAGFDDLAGEDGGAEDGSVGDATAADAGGPPAEPASRVGGLWASCYRGFETSGVPKRDVTRLALSCGPVSGMQQLGATVGGPLGPDASAEHRIEAAKGDCFRVFACAAGPSALTVTVQNGAGTSVAEAVGESWVVVDRERPLCTFDQTTFVVRVAGEGRGAYALQVWQLSPSKAR